MTGTNQEVQDFLNALRAYVEGDTAYKKAQITPLVAKYQVNNLPGLDTMTPEERVVLVELGGKLWQSTKANTLNVYDPELVGIENMYEMSFYVRIKAKYDVLFNRMDFPKRFKEVVKYEGFGVFNDDDDVNAKDFEGRTRLHHAAWHGRADVIQHLLQSETVDVNLTSTETNQTALHLAAASGHIDVIKALLKDRRVNVNAGVGSLIGTPLHTAAAQGRTEVVKLLMSDKRVEVNAKSLNQQTPLHFAAGYGKAEVVKLLMSDKRIEVNAMSLNQQTPLHFAASKGHLDVVETLSSDSRVDLNAKGDRLVTPFHSAVSSGSVALVEFFLSNERCDIHAKTAKGWNAIHYAVAQECTNVLSTLLSDERIDKNLPGKSNHTPLHYAIFRKHEAAVKMLLSTKNISVNATTDDGNTALDLACKWTQGERIVRVLLDYGADPNIGDEDQNTPIVNLLQKWSFSYEERSLSNDLRCIVLLGEHGADMNLYGLPYQAPLDNALQMQRAYEKVARVEYMRQAMMLNNLTPGRITQDQRVRLKKPISPGTLLFNRPPVLSGESLMQQVNTQDHGVRLTNPVSPGNSPFELLIHYGADVHRECRGVHMNILHILASFPHDMTIAFETVVKHTYAFPKQYNDGEDDGEAYTALEICSNRLAQTTELDEQRYLRNYIKIIKARMSSLNL